jgi:hypothetical protein
MWLYASLFTIPFLIGSRQYWVEKLPTRDTVLNAAVFCASCFFNGILETGQAGLFLYRKSLYYKKRFLDNKEKETSPVYAYTTFPRMKAKEVRKLPCFVESDCALVEPSSSELSLNKPENESRPIEPIPEADSIPDVIPNGILDVSPVVIPNGVPDLEIKDEIREI